MCLCVLPFAVFSHLTELSNDILSVALHCLQNHSKWFLEDEINSFVCVSPTLERIGMTPAVNYQRNLTQIEEMAVLFFFNPLNSICLGEIAYNLSWHSYKILE